MFTIYDHPSDYPNDFAVRGFTIRAGTTEPIPDADAQTAPTLEQARQLVPPGLFRLRRDPADDQCIVETWV